MTDESSPITQPFELLEQWRSEAPYQFSLAREKWLIGKAAQWGWDQRGAANEAELQRSADQELEACYAEVTFWGSKGMADRLQATRRPKPPSLKEMALEDLRSIELLHKEHKMVACTFNIRQVLEQLND